LRYKLSKETAADTLSFLFQNNFSGRAEIGLTGDDDFHFKVSPDGTNWIDALRIAAATGAISFPVSGTSLRQRLTAARTYYVDAAAGSDSNDGLAAGSGRAFATAQHAGDIVFGTLDLGGNNVTIQLADGTYGTVAQLSPQVGAGIVTIQGNLTTPGNVVVAATGGGVHAVDARNGAVLALVGFEVRSAAARGVHASRYSLITFSNLRFGACADCEIEASDLGYVQATGNYTIVGGGNSGAHWKAVGNGIIRVGNGWIVTILTPQNYTDAFASSLTGANIIVSSTSFVGSATGKTYDIQSNSVLQLTGLTLPG